MLSRAGSSCRSGCARAARRARRSSAGALPPTSASALRSRTIGVLKLSVRWNQLIVETWNSSSRREVADVLLSADAEHVEDRRAQVRDRRHVGRVRADLVPDVLDRPPHLAQQLLERRDELGVGGRGSRIRVRPVVVGAVVQVHAEHAVVRVPPHCADVGPDPARQRVDLERRRCRGRRAARSFAATAAPRPMACRAARRRRTPRARAGRSRRRACSRSCTRRSGGPRGSAGSSRRSPRSGSRGSVAAGERLGHGRRDRRDVDRRAERVLEPQRAPACGSGPPAATTSPELTPAVTKCGLDRASRSR